MARRLKKMRKEESSEGIQGPLVRIGYVVGVNLGEPDVNTQARCSDGSDLSNQYNKLLSC
jgi:hypothetical protein